MKQREKRAFVALAAIAVVAIWYVNSMGTPLADVVMQPIAQVKQAVQQSSAPSTPESVQEEQGGVISQPSNGLKVYTNAAFDFTFEYPASLSIETKGFGAGGFKAQGALGIVAVYIRMDSVINRLSVAVSAEPMDVGECLSNPNAKGVDINGAYFSKYQTSEMKDGQNIDATVYRIKRDKSCYELRETAVSTVETRLSLDAIKQQRANSAASHALIDSVVRSFRFRQ